MNHQSQENMLGHGFYNEHSHAQDAANEYALPLLTEAVPGIEQIQPAQQFIMADYGSAQGQNSLEPVKTVL